MINSHDEMSAMMEVSCNDKHKPFLEKIVNETGHWPSWMNNDQIEYILENGFNMVSESITASSTKLPYKTELKYCYHTLQGPTKKGIPNLILHKNGKRFRVRAELILFKGNEILLSKEDKPNQYGTYYKLPGGGIDNANESIESAAARECEEEVLIVPKNVKYTGVEYSELYKKIPHWHTICFHPDGIYYDGFISFICTAEYDKKYTGYVKVVDRDTKQASKATFYPYDEVKDMLLPIHRKVVEEYLERNRANPIDNQADYDEIINSFTDEEKKIWGMSSTDTAVKEKKALVFSKFLYDGYTPIAFAHCTDSDKLGLAKGDVNLSFAVHAKYRKKGLAVKVIKEAIKWFKDSKYETMSWIMDENNHASKRLAEKCGFVLMDHWKKKKQYFYMITNPSMLKAIGENMNIFTEASKPKDYKVKGKLLFRKLDTATIKRHIRSCPALKNAKTGPGIKSLVIIKLGGFGRTYREYVGEIAGYVTCNSKGDVLSRWVSPKAKNFGINAKLDAFVKKPVIESTSCFVTEEPISADESYFSDSLSEGNPNAMHKPVPKQKMHRKIISRKAMKPMNGPHKNIVSNESTSVFKTEMINESADDMVYVMISQGEDYFNSHQASKYIDAYKTYPIDQFMEHGTLFSVYPVEGKLVDCEAELKKNIAKVLDVDKNSVTVRAVRNRGKMKVEGLPRIDIVINDSDSMVNESTSVFVTENNDTQPLDILEKDEVHYLHKMYMTKKDCDMRTEDPSKEYDPPRNFNNLSDIAGLELQTFKGYKELNDDIKIIYHSGGDYNRIGYIRCPESGIQLVKKWMADCSARSERFDYFIKDSKGNGGKFELWFNPKTYHNSEC